MSGNINWYSGSETMNYFCCLGDFHDLAFFNAHVL